MFPRPKKKPASKGKRKAAAKATGKAKSAPAKKPSLEEAEEEPVLEEPAIAVDEKQMQKKNALGSIDRPAVFMPRRGLE